MRRAAATPWWWVGTALAAVACAGMLWLARDHREVESQLALQARQHQELVQALNALQAGGAAPDLQALERRLARVVERSVRDARLPDGPAGSEAGPLPDGGPEVAPHAAVHDEAGALGRDTLDAVLADGRLDAERSQVLGEALRATDGATRMTLLRELVAAINSDALRIDDPWVLDRL